MTKHNPSGKSRSTNGNTTSRKASEAARGSIIGPRGYNPSVYECVCGCGEKHLGNVRSPFPELPGFLNMAHYSAAEQMARAIGYRARMDEYWHRRGDMEDNSPRSQNPNGY